jgi:putative SOS response-associated peptidase YedK
MFPSMQATSFDMEAELDQRRIVIRRGEDGIEMVELAWGLKPVEPGTRPFTLLRAEGKRFPSHRCLVPATEIQLRRQGQRYRCALADGDLFYFAGIWRPASPQWPEAYAILTVDAGADLAPYQDRQMIVLKRSQRMDWLDQAAPDDELLRPLPKRALKVERVGAQTMFSFLSATPKEGHSGSGRHGGTSSRSAVTAFAEIDIRLRADTSLAERRLVPAGIGRDDPDLDAEIATDDLPDIGRAAEALDENRPGRPDAGAMASFAPPLVLGDEHPRNRAVLAPRRDERPAIPRGLLAAMGWHSRQ